MKLQVLMEYLNLNIKGGIIYGKASMETISYFKSSTSSFSYIFRWYN